MAIKNVAPVAGGSTGDGSELTPYLYWPTPATGNEYIQTNDYVTTGKSRTIDVSGSISDAIIDGLRSGGCTQADIWIADGSNLTIENCILNQSGSYSIVFYTGYVTNSKIKNNDFVGVDAKTAIVAYLDHAGGIEFSENTISNWGGSNSAATIVRFITANAPVVRDNIYANEVANAVGVPNGKAGYAFWFSNCVNAIVERNTVSNQVGNGFFFTGTSATVEDCEVENSYSAAGIQIAAASVVSAVGCVVTGTTGAAGADIHGFTVDSSTLNADGCVASLNIGDGFNISTSDALNCVRCTANGNGNTTNASSGDGFTAHNSCAADIHFCLGIGNLKSFCTFVQSTVAEVVHNTGINNWSANGLRAECFIYSTAACTVRNNVFCNLHSYTLARVEGDSGAHSWDYNAYIGNATNQFSIAGTAKTFAEWVAATGYDTHSWFIHEHDGQWDCYHGSAPSVVARTLSARPIDIATGRLVAVVGSPLIKSAPVIADVNDGGELDIWGNATTTMPNIGADQFDYAPGFGPWTPFDSSIPTLSLASTCPGSLLEVQEWHEPVTKKQIDGALK